MMFSKPLREGVRRGRIRCSIRIWTHPHVKVGGRYPMDDGHILVDSIAPIDIADVTHDLARESGFSDVQSLLETARHGRGDNVYLIRFHYLPPGAWAEPLQERAAAQHRGSKTLLQRIRTSTPATGVRKKGGGTSRQRGQ